MNKIYSAAASLAVIAAVFTACSNDEAVELKQNPAIGFNPLVNRSTATRGLSVETAANVKSFDVWAYAKPGVTTGEEQERLYMGYAKDGVQIKSGISDAKLGAFRVAETVWGYNVPGELAYWPATDMLQFVALSPAHDFTDGDGTQEANKTDVNYTFTDGTHDFAKTSQLGFTYTADNTPVAGVNTQLRDILAAANYQGWDINTGSEAFTGGHGSESTPANGNVPLIFRHLLSKIEFLGQIDKLNKNIKVDISSITIHNVQKTGWCKLTLDQTYTARQQDNFATTNPVVWTPSGDYINYVITKNTTLEYSEAVKQAAEIPTDNSTATTLLNAGDNLFLIPQAITAWDHNNATAADRTILKADTDHTVYLEIKAKITQNGIYILGSATEDGTAYCPLTTPDNAWKPGNKYTYTLIFGIGENADGDNIGRPITFSCSVTNWNNETTEAIEL